MAVTDVLFRAGVAALFFWTAASASSATECVETQSCRVEEAPRSSEGSAMIQSGQTPASLLEQRLATGSPPMKNTMDAVEKELDELENRVSTLESQVGNAGGGSGAIVIEPAPAPATPAPTVEAAPEELVLAQPAGESVKQQHKRGGHLGALMKKKVAQASHQSRSRSVEQEDDESWLYPSGQDDQSDSLSLLAEGIEHRGKGHAKKVGNSLKDRVGDAESRAVALKSKILGLENAVSGRVAPESAPDNVSGADLKHRLMALEDECDDLRTRATALEHAVMG